MFEAAKECHDGEKLNKLASFVFRDFSNDEVPSAPGLF